MRSRSTGATVIRGLARDSASDMARVMAGVLGCTLFYLVAMNPVLAGSMAGQPTVPGSVLSCEHMLQHQHRVGSLLWPGRTLYIGPHADVDCVADASPITAEEPTRPRSVHHE